MPRMFSRSALNERLAMASAELGVDEHPAEVEWAVETRFQADCDLVVIGENRGSILDPSARNGVGAETGFDATKPLAAEPMHFA